MTVDLRPKDSQVVVHDIRGWMVAALTVHAVSSF
jgi:hypothetical protein